MKARDFVSDSGERNLLPTMGETIFSWGLGVVQVNLPHHLGSQTDPLSPQL